MINPATLLEQYRPSDWVDLLCAAILLLGIIQGALRGFSGEVARLAGAVAALALALWLRIPLGRFLATRTRLGESAGEAPLVAFLVVLLLALMVAFLLRKLLGRFIRLVVTPTTDLMLGILSGGARMAVFLLVLFTILTWLPPSDSRNLALGHTRTGLLLAPLVNAVNYRITETPSVADSLRQFSGRQVPDRAGAEGSLPANGAGPAPTPPDSAAQ